MRTNDLRRKLLADMTITMPKKKPKKKIKRGMPPSVYITMPYRSNPSPIQIDIIKRACSKRRRKR
jgi:hypothetical protein